MELIPGLTLNVSFLVGIMVDITMVMLIIFSIVMIRQESLMDKVVSFSIGGSLKLLTWGFFTMTLIMTLFVLIV